MTGVGVVMTQHIHPRDKLVTYRSLGRIMKMKIRKMRMMMIMAISPAPIQDPGVIGSSKDKEKW